MINRKFRSNNLFNCSNLFIHEQTFNYLIINEKLGWWHCISAYHRGPFLGPELRELQSIQVWSIAPVYNEQPLDLDLAIETDIWLSGWFHCSWMSRLDKTVECLTSYSHRGQPFRWLGPALLWSDFLHFWDGEGYCSYVPASLYHLTVFSRRCFVQKQLPPSTLQKFSTCQQHYFR